MRPVLRAGLLPVWRDRDTLQFGVDPRRAVALEGLGPAAAVISLLDGSRDREHLIASAQAYGVPAGAVSRVLGLLAEAGVLDDIPLGLNGWLPSLGRLAPELATAALAYADGDGGARVLARRRAAFVRVHGAGRTAAVISLLDGSRDRAAVIAAAGAYGVPAQAASDVLAALAAAGVLDDYPARLHASLPDELRARLAPELATASLAYADGDGGARTLARRRAAFVRIHGAGRTGACVASFLAASGVGHVTCADPGATRPADLAPAGLIRADLGEPRQEGAARAVGRAAPDVKTLDDGAVPDLVILTAPALPDLAEGLIRDRVPHLTVWAGEAIGVVGPLVRPGRSACLRCVDMRKADADPAWPKILAQATFAPAQPQACDTVLAAMTATIASAQALAFIDLAGVKGPDPVTPVPATVNGTLEVVLPDWQWRRRTWPPYPSCTCGAVRVRTEPHGAFAVTTR